jgi:hypothetical protein
MRFARFAVLAFVTVLAALLLALGALSGTGFGLSKGSATAVLGRSRRRR